MRNATHLQSSWPLRNNEMSADSIAYDPSIKSQSVTANKCNSCISERVFYSSRRQRLHDADIIQSLYLAALFYTPINLRLQKKNAKLIIIAIKFLSLMMCLENFV